MGENEKPITERAPTGPVCPQCGATALPEQRYCGQCGAPLPEEAVAPADAAPRTPTATAEPLATTEAAPTGHEPGDPSKSWWGRRSRKAKIGLVTAGVAVLAAVAAGVVLSQVLPSSDPTLVQTLATTTDAETRQRAALDLAAQHSVEATGDLASMAETDDTARLGLEALRDVHVQELAALRASYVAEVAAEEAAVVLANTEDALTQTVDCLALIEDARSVDALGDFIRSGEAELVAVRVHAVEAVAGMDPQLALPLLRDAATIRGYPGRQVAEAAEAGLRDMPGAKPVTTTVAARTTTTGAVTTTTARATTTTTESTTTTTVPTRTQFVKWGSPAEIHGLRVTISEPSTNRQLVYNINGVPQEDKKIIFAKVVAENISSETAWFDLDLDLMDSFGKTYWAEANVEEGVAKEWSPVPWGDQLEPGEGFTGYTFFIVPAETGAKSIYCYRNDQGPSTVAASWGY